MDDIFGLFCKGVVLPDGKGLIFLYGTTTVLLCDSVLLDIIESLACL